MMSHGPGTFSVQVQKDLRSELSDSLNVTQLVNNHLTPGRLTPEHTYMYIQLPPYCPLYLPHRVWQE